MHTGEPTKTSDQRPPIFNERLANGTSVLIRPICADDAEAEREFLSHLSAETLRFRFLGQIATPSAELIKRFTDVDYVHDLAFVATISDGPRERIIGVARYATDESKKRCECAVVVSDAWQRHGIGTTLMRHLIDEARARGIVWMESMDFAENHAMNDLAKHLGFTTIPDPDDPTQVLHQLLLN
jgi:GNAT superfamily N-acetyltransferase